MPLSGAEKMRRRREKLREEGKYNEYKEFQKEACRKSRLKRKAFLKELPELKKKSFLKEERLKVKQRVAKFRAEKRKSHARAHEKPVSGYPNVQTLEKALSRIRKTLPKCLTKRKIVLEKLLEECGDFCQFHPCTQPPNKHALAANEDDEPKVKDEYECYTITEHSADAFNLLG